MSKTLTHIRSKIATESFSKSCTRKKCSVDMKDVPSCKIIVDMDKIPSAQYTQKKRCDFVLFLSTGGANILVALLELKGGTVDTSHAIEQLQDSAEFAEHISPYNKTISCRPILFHGGKMHDIQLKTLNRNKVTFLGVPLTIKTARCNESRNLAKALGM